MFRPRRQKYIDEQRKKYFLEMTLELGKSMSKILLEHGEEAGVAKNDWY